MIKHYVCYHTVCYVQKFYHEYLDIKVIETNLFIMFKYQNLDSNTKDKTLQV